MNIRIHQNLSFNGAVFYDNKIFNARQDEEINLIGSLKSTQDNVFAEEYNGITALYFGPAEKALESKTMRTLEGLALKNKISVVHKPHFDVESFDNATDFLQKSPEPLAEEALSQLKFDSRQF